MRKTIADSVRLSLEDKEIYKHAIQTGNVDHVQNMSIFSKKGSYEKKGEFNVFITDPSIDIYLVSASNLSFWVDDDKKILFYSRYFFNIFEELPTFVDVVLNAINYTNFSDCEYLGNNIVSIERWFATYGHYLDEAFVLADYINKYNNDSKVILDYPVIDQPNFRCNINYKTIEDLLFDSKSINAALKPQKTLRGNNLTLIRHRFADTSFHSFPLTIRDQLIRKIKPEDFLNNEKVFITRGKALHMPRNLENQSQIENYLADNNFKVINPETVGFVEFVKFIGNANTVVITWGGALTNLVFLKKGARVIILKSESYESETLWLFDKIIKTYELKVSVINHKNNNCLIKDICSELQL